MKIIEKSILDSSEEIIVHQVNCQGVMNAGLAKSIRKEYPIVYDKYMELCKDVKSKSLLLGRTQIIKVAPHKYVVNLFRQLYYGRDKNIVYTDYSALEKGFFSISEFAKENNLQVAVPYGLGCGLANGDWEKVST